MKPTVGIVLLVVLSIAAPIGAQWLNYPSSDVPRMRDGKVNLSAHPPKARDGKPDLSGIWRAAPDPQGKPEGVENEIFPRYFANIAKDFPPEDLVLRAPADTRFKERLQTQGKNAPEAIEMTIDDPATYAKPFTYTQPAVLLPDTDLLEYFCTENEKDVRHFK